jgi:diguanylate cyclase (GGDEF)-like protein
MSMDRRVLGGLVAGGVGAVAGLAAAVLGMPALAIVAALGALGAATATALIAAELAQHRGEAVVLAQGMEVLKAEAARLEEAAVAGREALQVAGTFAELVAKRNAELAAQAGPEGLIDEETGLPDGRYFERTLDQRVAISRRQLRPVSVVLLQLERDDRVDDSWFASLLHRVLRESDTACRISNDLYGLILEDTAEAGGVWAAERVRAFMAHDGKPIEIVSAGVASYPSHALDAPELFSRGKVALEQANSKGRGQVEVATAD